MKLGRAPLLGSLVCAVCLATMDFTPAKGIARVATAVAASAHVDLLDATMTLTPTAADYVNDYIQITGASGLRVRLWTNNAAGVVLYVKCADAAPQIALADFLVKTQTAPGAGGTSLTTFTAVSASDQLLWSSGAPVAMWTQVNMDIRIKNLSAYGDAPGGATTTYTDVLTFTVVMQ